MSTREKPPGSGKTSLLILLLLVTGAQALRSQDESGNRRAFPFAPPADSLNSTSIVFDKSLNTYHWMGTTLYNAVAGPFSAQLNEQFLSTLIQSDQKLINDNQSLNLRLHRLLNDQFQLAGAVTSFVLSDNRGIGISNASSHAMYGGFSWLPTPAISVEPLAGYRFDTQREQQDQGPSYWLMLDSNPFLTGGYLTQLGGNFQYDAITPRTQETYTAHLGLERTFEAGTRNMLQFQYYRNRRDFYFDADSVISRLNQTPLNIETRADNSLSLLDTLGYAVSRAMQLSFAGTVFTRSIDRSTRYKNILDLNNSSPDSHIGQFRIEGSARIQYAPSARESTMVMFSYQEQDEQHNLIPFDGSQNSPDFASLDRIEQRKNNHSRRTSLYGEISSVVSNSDTVVMSGSGNLLHYDTQSPENDDDRDELLYIANITTRHRINQHLYLVVSGDVSLMHLVYLFSTRSADNTWNRILRLSPKIWYRPSKEFSTMMNFEVLANYMSYDFDYASATVRSFVFRQFSFIDSATATLSKRITLDWFSQLRLYERGELQWDAFTERPINEFHESMLVGGIDYALTERLLFSVGIRYFSQTRYGFAGSDRTVENYLRSIGPMTAINMKVGERTVLSIKGWYERLSQTNQVDHSYTTLVMMLSFRL